MAGDGLCVQPAIGGDVAGVDSGLRAARAALAWRSAGQAFAGQRADAGSAAGALTRSGCALVDPAGDVAAPPDPDSRECVGGRQGWLAGGGYGGAMRRERGGEFVWMVDGVDYVTAWVEVRAMWGRGQAGTLAALQDVEASLPFALLGLDSDNGGEFLNHHVMSWLQKRKRPVFMTRSRPYKKDDNAHVEQKNWTHIRQCFGYERHDNPEVVELINALVKGAYGQLLNYFHASLKLERKERTEGRLRRVYGEPQTPLARVLASAQVKPQTKRRLEQEKARLNPFALKQSVARSLKAIASLRQARPAGETNPYGGNVWSWPGWAAARPFVRICSSMVC